MSEIEHLYFLHQSKPHRTNHIPNWRTKIEPLKEMPGIILAQ